MDLSKVLSIAGKPGLYKVVGQMKNGVLVESMTDGKRFPAYAHHQLSLLSEISIYGEEGDLPLEEVMDKIHSYKKAESLDVPKDNEEIIDLFTVMVGAIDEDRVYPSDAKKVFKWYNDLLSNKLFDSKDKKEVKKQAKKTAKKTEKKVEKLSDDTSAETT